MYLSDRRKEYKCAISSMKAHLIRKLCKVIFFTSIIYTYLMGILGQITIVKGLLQLCGEAGGHSATEYCRWKQRVALYFAFMSTVHCPRHSYSSDLCVPYVQNNVQQDQTVQTYIHFSMAFGEGGGSNIFA